MQPEQPLKHRVFPEGYDTRRGRKLTPEQRFDRERRFAAARQLRQADDAAAVAALLREINPEATVDTSAYLNQLFPAFENLSPAQQRLVIAVCDPARSHSADSPNYDDELLTLHLIHSLKPTWRSRWIEVLEKQ